MPKVIALYADLPLAPPNLGANPYTVSLFFAITFVSVPNQLIHFFHLRLQTLVVIAGEPPHCHSPPTTFFRAHEKCSTTSALSCFLQLLFS